MVVEVQMQMPKNVFQRIKLTDSHSMNELVVHIFQMLRVKLHYLATVLFTYTHTLLSTPPSPPIHLPAGPLSLCSAQSNNKKRYEIERNERRNGKTNRNICISMKR